MEKVYGKLIAHFIKGVMFHSELADYYDFLGLSGYRDVHEKRQYSENKALSKLKRYFTHMHDKMLYMDKIERNTPIPQSWYRYTRSDVDEATRKNAVRDGIDMWLAWEEETKRVLEESYKYMMEYDYISDAQMLSCCIQDVCEELRFIKAHKLKLESVNYDTSYIINEQSSTHF